MEIKIIGTAETCFTEKFGIPRQSGLVPASWGVIKLAPPFNMEVALRGLDSFSHIILTWIPHESKENTNLTVKPPRLGGNKKLGVFATRSPYRPNPICTSIVKLDEVNFELGHLKISNHDLLNGTPIIDIKPYLPMWDSLSEANNGWAGEKEEEKIRVEFDQNLNVTSDLHELITQILNLNPKPPYQQEKLNYALKLNSFDIHFRYEGQDLIHVYKIVVC